MWVLSSCLPAASNPAPHQAVPRSPTSSNRERNSLACLPYHESGSTSSRRRPRDSTSNRPTTCTPSTALQDEHQLTIFLLAALILFWTASTLLVFFSSTTSSTSSTSAGASASLTAGTSTLSAAASVEALVFLGRERDLVVAGARGALKPGMTRAAVGAAVGAGAGAAMAFDESLERVGEVGSLVAGGLRRVESTGRGRER